MAAPSIPNLNSFRTGRGRGRGRGLGGSSSHESSLDKSSNDRIVQQTDQDASVSRMSAVNAGYLNDPFAKLFVSSEALNRLPIINRGTYVRTKAIDKLVDEFLNAEPPKKKQIISLGAGTDTRYFRIMLRYDILEEPNFLYHEIDFPENTSRKLKEVSRHSKLAESIRYPVPSMSAPSSPGDPSIHLDAPFYHVHPLDLRDLDPSKEPPRTFKSIDPSLPTLIISECCLVYLAPAAADAVANYFTKTFFQSSTPLGMVLYEPINPDDAFGKVMVSNLAARGIVLQTLRKYGSLETQAARMSSYGFDDSRGADVNHLWERGVEEQEKERVAGLEMVDEVEEWKLLAEHYCVVWGWKNGDHGDGSELWDLWKKVFL